MNITFRKLESFDGSRFSVLFPAEVDGKHVFCAISGEALQDAFGAGESVLIAFQLNRFAVEAKAKELILSNRFEADGTICIRSQDFTPLQRVLT